MWTNGRPKIQLAVLDYFSRFSFAVSFSLLELNCTNPHASKDKITIIYIQKQLVEMPK